MHQYSAYPERCFYDGAKLALSAGFQVTLVTERITLITDSKRLCSAKPSREYAPTFHAQDG